MAGPVATLVLAHSLPVLGLAPGGDDSPAVRVGRPAAPSVRPAARASQVAPRSASGLPAGLWLESNPVAFGNLVPGTARELPGALRARVRTDRPWTLRLVLAGDLSATDQPARLPAERLAWRPSGGGAFRPLDLADGAVIARGPATSADGALVEIDLRLALETNDPLGGLSGSLHLELVTDSVAPVLSNPFPQERRP